ASPAPRWPGFDRRRTAPTPGGAPDRSTPARPSSADDGDRGPERASTCLRPSGPRRPWPGPAHSSLDSSSLPPLRFGLALPALPFGLPLHAVQMALERLDAGHPEPAERSEPGFQLHERLGAQPVDAALRVHLRLDEARVPQHAEVL